MVSRSIVLFVLTLCLLVHGSFIPNQLLKTRIHITVLNKLGNPVEGATVALYSSEDDYKKSQNPVLGKALTTDKKGKVTFLDIPAQDYFVRAEKGDMDNVGAGEKIEKMEPNRINKVTIVISDGF